MEKIYIIDFGTLAERKTGEFDDIKKYADENIGYIAESVVIYDGENGKEVCRRQWWGVEYDPELYEDGENTDIIDYGKFGYFDEWENA